MNIQPEVVVGLLTLAGTIITVIFGQRHLKDDITTQLDKHDAVQDERIRSLTAKVEKHNQVVERTYRLEGKVEELDKLCHAKS